MDISAKVWRYTGEKWSRQSEELPLHRVLDLAILICRARGYFADAYRYPKLYDEEEPQIDRIGVQGDAMTVSVCTDNPMIDEDIRLFSEALSRDDELLAERLHVLSNLLQDMGYGPKKAGLSKEADKKTHRTAAMRFCLLKVRRPIGVCLKTAAALR